MATTGAPTSSPRPSSNGGSGGGGGATTALKVLIVGNSNTGKSCLTLRFVEETFTQSFVPTIGIDFHVKSLEVDGRKVKLQIWDTAGQERFHNVTRTYFRGAAAVLLVYDICDRESFDWLVKWRDQVVEYTGDMSTVVLAVVGNKCDRNEERQVSEEEGREAAQKLGVHLFFESSAKSGVNVNELFTSVARAAIAKVPQSKSALGDDDKIKLGSKPAAKSAMDSCCAGSMPGQQQGSAI